MKMWKLILILYLCHNQIQAVTISGLLNNEQKAQTESNVMQTVTTENPTLNTTKSKEETDKITDSLELSKYSTTSASSTKQLIDSIGTRNFDATTTTYVEKITNTESSKPTNEIKVSISTLQKTISDSTVNYEYNTSPFISQTSVIVKESDRTEDDISKTTNAPGTITITRSNDLTTTINHSTQSATESSKAKLSSPLFNEKITIVYPESSQFQSTQSVAMENKGHDKRNLSSEQKPESPTQINEAPTRSATSTLSSVNGLKVSSPITNFEQTSFSTNEKRSTFIRDSNLVVSTQIVLNSLGNYDKVQFDKNTLTTEPIIDKFTTESLTRVNKEKHIDSFSRSTQSSTKYDNSKISTVPSKLETSFDWTEKKSIISHEKPNQNGVYDKPEIEKFVTETSTKLENLSITINTASTNQNTENNDHNMTSFQSIPTTVAAAVTSKLNEKSANDVRIEKSIFKSDKETNLTFTKYDDALNNLIMAKAIGNNNHKNPIPEIPIIFTTTTTSPKEHLRNPRPLEINTKKLRITTISSEANSTLMKKIFKMATEKHLITKSSSYYERKSSFTKNETRKHVTSLKSIFNKFHSPSTSTPTLKTITGKEKKVSRSTPQWSTRNPSEPDNSFHPVCTLNVKEGMGSDISSSWFYNDISRRCEWFSYHGEEGNGNRFNYRANCENYCIGRQQDLCSRLDLVHCEERWLQCRMEIDQKCNSDAEQNNKVPQLFCPPEQPICVNKNGRSRRPPLYLTHRSMIPQECKEKMDSGHCQKNSNSVLVFHYDAQLNDCSGFLYSHCGGNSNRFRTKKECMNHCAF